MILKAPVVILYNNTENKRCLFYKIIKNREGKEKWSQLLKAQAFQTIEYLVRLIEHFGFQSLQLINEASTLLNVSLLQGLKPNLKTILPLSIFSYTNKPACQSFQQRL